MPVCPSCARDVPAGAGFCGYCGARLAGPGPGAMPPAPEAPRAAWWTCPCCSAENDAAASVCLACGSLRVESAVGPVAMPPTGAARWTCATCGQVNDPAAELCCYCGAAAAVSGGEPAVAARKEQARGGGTEPQVPHPRWAGGEWPPATDSAARTGIAPSGAAPPVAGMAPGVWLVMIGGLLVLAASFVWWGLYSEKTGSTWSGWTWYELYAGTRQWSGLWPPNTVDILAYWSQEADGLAWVPVGIGAGWAVMIVMCVLAGVQALRRGFAGARVSGGVLRAIGVAALVTFIAIDVYWAALSPTVRSVWVSDIPALIGALLIIAGGTLMGPAPPRLLDASVRAPGRR